MQAALLHSLSQHFPTHRHFLVGLSGGVDSVVLLHLFAQLRDTLALNIRAVHIHHGLSPNADSWASFCQQLCTHWQIPLLIQNVQVEGKNGLEGNARTARYQAIQTLIQPNEIFCTAHHLDDHVETFFLALKRGAGLKGLSAIQAVSSWQKFTLFRPLLNSTKAEILAYATEQQLTWIEDESNQNDHFDRNFLRNQILPPLNQRWSHFNQMVSRASRHCAEQQQLIEELLAEELSQRLNLTQQSLNIAHFEQFSRLKQQQLIRLWLEKCGVLMPSQSRLDTLIETMVFAQPDKHPQMKLDGKVILRYQHTLFITQVQFAPIHLELVLTATTQYCLLANGLGCVYRNANELICKIQQQSYRLLLPDELRDQPLTIKCNPPSKVKCYGKPHHEEMKKIWQENQIPVWERSRTPLLFIENEFVAVFTKYFPENNEAPEDGNSHSYSSRHP